MAQRGVSAACSTLRQALKSNQVVPRRCASLKEANVIKPPQNVLETMSKYQAREVDTPIHVIEGPGDRIIFSATMGACIAGLAGFAYLAYELGFKRK